METKQLEFEFMNDMRKASGEVCLKCKNFREDSSTCGLSLGEVDPQSTCGFWDYNTDIGMGEIANECKDEFNQLMDKYSISEEDRVKIYNNAKWF